MKRRPYSPRPTYSIVLVLLTPEVVTTMSVTNQSPSETYQKTPESRLYRPHDHDSDNSHVQCWREFWSEAKNRKLYFDTTKAGSKVQKAEAKIKFFICIV